MCRTLLSQMTNSSCISHINFLFVCAHVRWLVGLFAGLRKKTADWISGKLVEGWDAGQELIQSGADLEKAADPGSFLPLSLTLQFFQRE